MEEERKRREGTPQARMPLLGEGVRILRLAESLMLSPKTLDKIKGKLFGAAAESVAQREAKQADPVLENRSAYPAVEMISDAEIQRLTRTLGKAGAAAEVTPAPVRSAQTAPPTPASTTPNTSTDDIALAELGLRKKIEAAQNWSSFKADAWRLYERFPRADTAARIVELALMYGSAQELEEVLASLNRQGLSYYPLMASSIRTHAIIKLWQAKRFEFIEPARLDFDGRTRALSRADRAI